jgi:hypothetical protein
MGMSDPRPNSDVARDSASEAGRKSAPQDASARLARAEIAYAAGDFSAVHGLCASLAAAHVDPDLSARARALSERVAIDPANWIVLACALALWVAIVAAYVG